MKYYSIRRYQDLEEFAKDYREVINLLPKKLTPSTHISIKVSPEAYEFIAVQLINRNLTYANKEALTKSTEMRLTINEVRIQLYI